MSDFLDVTASNDKKKQLLAWLMQQAQNSPVGGMGALQASEAAVPSPALASRGSGFGGMRTAFNSIDSRRSDPNVTGLSTVGLGLSSLLGPGAAGRAVAADRSAAPGLPVTPPAPVFQTRPGLGGPNILPVTPPVVGGGPQAGPPAPANPVNVTGPGVPIAPGIFLDPNSLLLHGAPRF